jgi:hypothetical protein
MSYIYKKLTHNYNLKVKVYIPPVCYIFGCDEMNEKKSLGKNVCDLGQPSMERDDFIKKFNDACKKTGVNPELLYVGSKTAELENDLYNVEFGISKVKQISTYIRRKINYVEIDMGSTFIMIDSNDVIMLSV